MNIHMDKYPTIFVLVTLDHYPAKNGNHFLASKYQRMVVGAHL